MPDIGETRIRFLHRYLRRHCDKYGPDFVLIHEQIVAELGHQAFLSADAIENVDAEREESRLKDAWGRAAKRHHLCADFDRIVGAIGWRYEHPRPRSVFGDNAAQSLSRLLGLT